MGPDAVSYDTVGIRGPMWAHLVGAELYWLVSVWRGVDVIGGRFIYDDGYNFVGATSRSERCSAAAGDQGNGVGNNNCRLCANSVA